MKQAPYIPIGRARQCLTLGLAGLLAVATASGQTASSDALRQLQEENAALRKKLAQMEGKAPSAAPAAQASTAAAPAASTGSSISAPAEEGTVVMSPFQVTSEKDYGYLKTNAATATRIGMEIQKVPLNISVISEEFIQDTNARSLMDLFRYSAAASGDTRFAMRVPANEATPQGAFTMRGFTVNTLMRNGVFRYISHNLDNVDRIEVVKGPATVFFGQGYPGGVINFITKTANFNKIPTTVSYTINDNSGQRLNIDHNAVLTPGKAAIRFVGSWEDTQGERRFEFRKSIMANPSIKLVPFEAGKLTITAELEHSLKRYNQNDYDWIYSDAAGWYAAARSGAYGSSTATLSSTIAANTGNGLAANVVQATTTPTLAYSTYINNIRVATSNLMLPAYTSVKRGAYYINNSGNMIHDEAFNYTSRGAYSDERDDIFTLTLESSPLESVDLRYVYSNDTAKHNSVGQGGAITTPYADGMHFNVATGNRSGYYRATESHIVDGVYKFELLGAKHKLLAGMQYSKWLQQYLGNAAVTDANWAFLPGARNTTSNPDYATTASAAYKVKYDLGGVPVNQVIYQRDGSIKPVRQIYNNFDPGFELYPDINTFFQDDRNALDGYKPTLMGTYLNYQGSLFNDRLTFLAGYRKEKRWERGQWQVNNYPWYIYQDQMWNDPVKYPENVWGHSIAYQKTVPIDSKGDSWMIGASWAVNKNLSAYVSSSKIFKFNTGNIGGYFPGDEVYLVQGLLEQYASIGQTGFSYRGQTVTSVAQFQDIIKGLKYPDMIPNEQGMNYEAGLKYSTDDNKIVGTWSIFSADRQNQKLDDGVAQSNLNEPLNSNTDPNFIAGVNRAIAKGATYSPASSSTGRLFRVRSYGNKVRIAGTEVEVIWTPKRNIQVVANASYLPTAKQVADNRPVYSKPGSAYYTNTLTAAQKRDADILWNARVENVPEYRLNVFGKYTFTDDIFGGYGRGLSIGGGMRYSSETVVSRSVDWNPLAGGYQAGNYVVFDVTVGMPWEMFGYKVRSQFGLYNATNETYSEGSFALSPARNWIFSNSLSF